MGVSSKVGLMELMQQGWGEGAKGLHIRYPERRSSPVDLRAKENPPIGWKGRLAMGLAEGGLVRSGYVKMLDVAMPRGVV